MEMTEQQIQQMIESAINNRESRNQYGVAKIPYHIHNGTDSPFVFNKEGFYEVISNKKTTMTNSDTDYPSTSAVTTSLATKQNSLGYTAENTANKATDFTTLNNTKYPSTQAVSNFVTAKVPNFSASDDLLVKTTASTISKTDTTPVKFIEVNCPVSGTLRIKWSIGGTPSFAAFSQIYRNGSAVGTLNNLGTGGVVNTLSEDISGWTAGDKIQIYGYTNTGLGATVSMVVSSGFAEDRIMSVYGIQLVWSYTTF